MNNMDSNNLLSQMNINLNGNFTPNSNPLMNGMNQNQNSQAALNSLSQHMNNLGGQYSLINNQGLNNMDDDGMG